MLTGQIIQIHFSLRFLGVFHFYVKPPGNLPCRYPHTPKQGLPLGWGFGVRYKIGLLFCNKKVTIIWLKYNYIYNKSEKEHQDALCVLRCCEVLGTLTYILPAAPAGSGFAYQRFSFLSSTRSFFIVFFLIFYIITVWIFLSHIFSSRQGLPLLYRTLGRTILRVLHRRDMDFGLWRSPRSLVFVLLDIRYMPFIVPTNTCYGIAGQHTSEEYDAIYRLKGRDFSKPLAWIVADYDDLHDYIETTEREIEFLKNYPRPWTILAPRKASYRLPDFLDPTQYSRIAFRVATAAIPDVSIREQLSYPLFLTSANLSGQKESSTLEEALRIFDGIHGYDGGVCDEPPSDIFSFTRDGGVEYLRRN